MNTNKDFPGSSPETTSEIPDGMASSTESNEALQSGEVRERLNELPSENQASNAGSKGEDSKVARVQMEDLSAQDREQLRHRLLENAPAVKVMKQEIQTVLEEKKTALYSQMKVFRRNREHHALSLAMAEFRKICKTIKKLATLSLEGLKELWVQLVHGLMPAHKV